MKPNVSFSLDDKIVAATTEDTSATKQQIPKEHKFVVSGVAMQSLAVLSHTAGDKASKCVSVLPINNITGRRLSLRLTRKDSGN